MKKMIFHIHFLFLNSTYLVIKGLIPLNNSIFYSLNLISTSGNYSFSIEIYSYILKAMKQFKDIYNKENYTKDIIYFIFFLIMNFTFLNLTL